RRAHSEWLSARRALFVSRRGGARVPRDFDPALLQALQPKPPHQPRIVVLLVPQRQLATRSEAHRGGVQPEPRSDGIGIEHSVVAPFTWIRRGWRQVRADVGV